MVMNGDDSNDNETRSPHGAAAVWRVRFGKPTPECTLSQASDVRPPTVRSIVIDSVHALLSRRTDVC